MRTACDATRRLRLAGVCAAVLLSAVGCASTNPATTDLRRDVQRLEQEVRERDDRIASLVVDLEANRRALEQARGLSDADLSNIFTPTRIEIDSRTSGVDVDARPGDDGVTVYFRPIDAVGDAIKVAGDVRVQLFDLAAPPDQNLLATVELTAEQLTQRWYGKLLTYFYKVECPWGTRRPSGTDITVRVTFSDYVTRRIITEQSTIRVKLGP